MTRFVRFLLAHRRAMAVLLALSVIAAAYSARTIRPRFQVRDFYDYPGVAGLTTYKQDLSDFGDPAGYVVVTVSAKDVFARGVLDYVARLTDQLEPNPRFSRVKSLTNTHVVRGHGDDVSSGSLFAGLAPGEEVPEDVRGFATDSPLLRRRLISPDRTMTAVLAEMRTPPTIATVDDAQAALDAAKEVLGRNPPPPGIGVRVTGSLAVEAGVTTALMKDQTVLTPLVVTALALVLFLVFRSWQGIALCLAAVNVALTWTAGAFALLGRPVDVIGSVIPITILSYGVVDPIFVFARFLTKHDAGRSKDDAIVEALSELGLPCFLTSVTTALGFAAFVLSRAPTIRYYGGTVAIGVLMSWATTMLVLPILLSYAPTPKRRFSALGSTTWLDRRLVGLWGFLGPRVAMASVLACGLLAAGAYFGRVQHLDNSFVDSLPVGSTHDDVRTTEERLSGTMRLVVHLEGPRDSMKRPEVLRAMEQVAAAARREPSVTSATSLADVVAQANQAFFGGDAAERRVPATPTLVAQYLSLIDPSDRSDFVSDDYGKAALTLLIKDGGSESLRALSKVVRGAIDASGFQALGVTPALTGLGQVYYDEVDNVVLEVLRGFVTAFAIIVAVQWLLFRSLRLALIGVLPNLLPVVACFACLRIFHIPLRIDSAIVLCIAIGGLFNTTIHLSARVLQRVEESDEAPDDVVLHALRAVGPAAFFTASVLSVGFGLLMASSFPGLRMLGLLSAVTLIVGFVADMAMTSALLRLGFDWKRRRREPKEFDLSAVQEAAALPNKLA